MKKEKEITVVLPFSLKLVANAARAISLWKCGSISLLPKRLVVNLIN